LYFYVLFIIIVFLLLLGYYLFSHVIVAYGVGILRSQETHKTARSL